MDAGCTNLGTPVIVRIAGLPAGAVAPFGSAACLEAAAACERLAGELATVRGLVVDELHKAIAGAPGPVRRALLAIRRDCYNGRDVAASTASPAWAIFAQTAPRLAARIGELEERLAVQRQAFAASFRSECERESRHLQTLLDDDNLRQGLALASPEVLRHLDRLRKPVASHQRRERRLLQTLLRYVSRAALKLSPFSTLTRLGLAEVADETMAAPVALHLAGATQRELRRVKKHVAVKFFTLLRDHPPFRDRLQVQLNPSVEAIGEGRYRFIKPFHWQLNREAREFRYFNEDQVAANLRGPLIDKVRELLRWERPFGELVRLAAAALGSEPAVVEMVLQKLLQLGFILLLFPWPTNAFDPERALLDFLERLPPDGWLDELTRTLRRLLELRDAAPPIEARLAGYEEIDALRMRGFRILGDGLGLPAVKEEVNDREIKEDVFLLPAAGDAARGAVARVSLQAAAEAFASVRPLVLYSDLNYTRYELLHSLKALAAERWPGRQEIGFLDLFHAAQPLWGDYVKAATAAITAWQTEVWNPFGLEELRDLKRLRDRVLQEMEECMWLDGDELVLDRDGAERATSRIPEMYVPACGPCLFAQPAAAGGDRWVLNHMLDGTGRFSNRFTTVMPGGLRDLYAAHLAAAGAQLSLAGEPAEMIEILCARDDHLNVHAVQTARVIELPGENADLPPERRLGARDLRVRFDGPLPVLADRAGRRLLPVFLGTNGLVGMPTLVRFLSRFGIGEFRLIHPGRPAPRRDGVTTQPRLRIGNLVVRRRMWAFSPAASLAGCATASDEGLFLAVNRWRLRHGIPARVFAAERLQAKFDLWPLHKPQYLDLTSPCFMPILRSLIESSPDELKIQEMLPEPEAFPTSEDGRRWAVEAQLESIACHRVHAWRSPALPVASSSGPPPQEETAPDNRANGSRR
jgi:hypothetical protein